MIKVKTRAGWEYRGVGITNWNSPDMAGVSIQKTGLTNPQSYQILVVNDDPHNYVITLIKEDEIESVTFGAD